MLKTIVVVAFFGVTFVLVLLFWVFFGPDILLATEPTTTTEIAVVPTETLEPTEEEPTRLPTATFTPVSTSTQLPTPTPTVTPIPVLVLTDEGESWDYLIEIMQELDPDIGYELGLCSELPSDVVTKIVYEETEGGEEFTCIIKVYFAPLESRTRSLWLDSYEHVVREAPELLIEPRRFIGDSYMLVLGLQEYDVDIGFFTEEEVEIFQEEVNWPVVGLWGISEAMYEHLGDRIRMVYVSLGLP